MIKLIVNRYDGVMADETTLPDDPNEFAEEIAGILASLQDKKLLWVKIPIGKSDFIPILTRLDFEFHHCDEKNLMLVKKLHPDAVLPATKNYIAGVGAIVLHQGRLLVVKDRFFAGYKLPGGHIDKNESLKDALKREVFEETGIQVEFESIMNVGHFRNGQFGESNLYLVCTAKARSTEITINDSSEIVEARWIAPEDFLQSDEVNAYNKGVVEAALHNKELKLIERQIKLRVTGGEVFF
ncbi:MAG: NUDIX domain-containing protein [Mangrovibacterium sp.]